jgi:hypothetical protein
VKPGATPRERFSAPERAAPEPASDDLIDYTLPEGWTALAATSERYVNLRPAGDPEASCTLSFLPGSGGGLVDNVNRWRAQLEQPPFPLFGRVATIVEAEGTFRGMGQGAPRAGFKLLGLLVCEPGGSLFLKFTGPSGLVDQERERFFALSTSLRITEQHGPNDGHDHGSDAAPEARLRWNAPEGWTLGAPRFGREVTFALEDGAECYVTRLAGDGGGLKPNLDRWAGQVGQEALDEAALAALERVAMLGQSVPLLEVAGDLTGMDGVTREDQALLGVACIRPGESLFVKLTGPAATVRAERANFLAFIQSLSEGG